MKKLFAVLFVIVLVLSFATPVAALGNDTNTGKVKICHNPGPHQQTIKVSVSALFGHLWHGDYLGACNPWTPPVTPTPTEPPVTEEPTEVPTETQEPTEEPTEVPTDEPTDEPTETPVVIVATPEAPSKSCADALGQILHGDRSVGYRYFDTHDWCYAWAQNKRNINVHYHRVLYP